MKIIFSKLAKIELDDSVAFYELQVSGLGKEFKREIKNSLDLIKKYTLAWSIERVEIRKSLSTSSLTKFYIPSKEIISL